MDDDRYPHESEIRVQITAWAAWKKGAGASTGVSSIAWDEFVAQRRDEARAQWRPVVITADAERCNRVLRALDVRQRDALLVYHLVSTEHAVIAREVGCHRNSVDRLMLIAHDEFMRIRGRFFESLSLNHAGLQPNSSVNPHR